MKTSNIIISSVAIVVRVLLPWPTSAQAPEKMNYQAVVRNSINELVADQTIGMQISILQGSESGTPEYVETQTPTTNANGMVTIIIGDGAVVSGNFAAIDWANGPYYIKTETDPAGGTDYSITGTSQLLSVPYALYAETVQTGDDWGTQTTVTNATLSGNGTTATPLIIAQNGATNGQVLQWDGSSWLPADDGLKLPTQINGNDEYALLRIFNGTGPVIDVMGDGYGIWASAEGDDPVGLYGWVMDATGKAVKGESAYTSGINYGVYGSNVSPEGVGVYGTAPTYAVYGVATEAESRAVTGEATAERSIGVKGVALEANSTGVWGEGAIWDFYAAGSGNYGPFTGAHDVKLAGDFPVDCKAGLIVSATGIAIERTDATGNVNISTTLPEVALCSKANDKAVFGVMVKETGLTPDHWYKGNGRFAIVNALGEGRVWVCDAAGNIEAGDYITSSDVPGYGRKQADDVLHSYTVGKATETINWDKVTTTIDINGKLYKVYLVAVVYTCG